jgi:predicted nucleic acid-binding protein
LGVVLDSTIWIAAERNRLSVVQTLEAVQSAVGDEITVIPAMTAAELVHGLWRANRPDVRARREEFIEEIFARVPVQSMTLRIARIMGHLEATARLAGRSIPTADLIIAATALDLEFAVATANVRHFKSIPGLRVLMAL